MRRKALTLAGLVALHACGTPCPAFAADSAPDYSTPATEWVYQGMAVADMLTTLDIKHCPALQETNPILGAHPTDGRVIGYFAITGLLHYAITRELVTGNMPRSLVQFWEGTGIALEAGMVGHNYSIGLRARF